MPSGLVQFCFLWNNLLVEITPSTKVNVWKHIYCIFYLFRLTFFHFSLFISLFLSLLLSPSSFISFFVSIKWPRTKFALCTLFVNIIFVSVAQYIDNETKVCDQTPHTPENASLNSLVNAETFYNNISIILGNEPLSTVRRNLIAGSALMLISIKRKENWANKAKKKVILNNNLQIITLTGISW